MLDRLFFVLLLATLVPLAALAEPAGEAPAAPSPDPYIRGVQAGRCVEPGMEFSVVGRDFGVDAAGWSLWLTAESGDVPLELREWHANRIDVVAPERSGLVPGEQYRIALRDAEGQWVGNRDRGLPSCLARRAPQADPEAAKTVALEQALQEARESLAAEDVPVEEQVVAEAEPEPALEPEPEAAPESVAELADEPEAAPAFAADLADEPEALQEVADLSPAASESAADEAEPQAVAPREVPVAQIPPPVAPAPVAPPAVVTPTPVEPSGIEPAQTPSLAEREESEAVPAPVPAAPAPDAGPDEFEAEEAPSESPSSSEAPAPETPASSAPTDSPEPPQAELAPIPESVRPAVVRSVLLADEAGHLASELGSEPVPPASLSVAILTPDEGPPPRPASAGPEPVLVPTPTALPAAPAPEVEDAAQTSAAVEPASAFGSDPVPAAQAEAADESSQSPVPAAAAAADTPGEATKLARRGPSGPATNPRRTEALGDHEPRQLLMLTASMDVARELARSEREQGYSVRMRLPLHNLGFALTVLRAPDGVPLERAIANLRGRHPEARFAPNHRYRLLGAGGGAPHPAHAQIEWGRADERCGAGLRLGAIDSLPDVQHPALAGQEIQMSLLLPMGVLSAPPDHGTALASLLVGRPDATGPAGLLPGATLFVAGAFRERRDGVADGALDRVLVGLEWLMGNEVDVVALPFGGPENFVLETAIDSILRRGVPVVAAAGDAGPDAPPAHPAALPGVVAVTAVDAAHAPYRLAGRGDHVTFAAPGVDLLAAGPGGKQQSVSGTSYAVPFVAASLAAQARVSGAGAALSQLERTALDLGAPGRDPIFGYGLVQAPNACQAMEAARR